MWDEGRAEYVRYKLEQARETWQEAECLYSAGKYRGCASRGYFAFYKAVLAALVAGGAVVEDRGPRHSQALGRFNKLYVRPGRLSRELGRFLNELERLRVRADYRDQAVLAEEAQGVIEQGRGHLEIVCQFAEQALLGGPGSDGTPE